MRPMKLKDVEAHTGIIMTEAEAKTYASAGFGCYQQACALSMMTWRNTSTDWLRLQACLTHLKLARQRKGELIWTN